jgi:putative transposase
MPQDERDFILNSAARLEEWENTPRDFEDPYCDMTTEEKSKLLILQQQMLDERQLQVEAAEARAARSEAKLDKIMSQLSQLMDMVRQRDTENARLRDELAQADKKITALAEQVRLGRKNRFGSKSQRGTKMKGPEERTHQEDKDDFDGTNPPTTSGSDTQSAENPSEVKPRTDRQKMADLMRRGTTYRKMAATDTVTHRSALNRLPRGAEFVKMESRYAYEQQTAVIEHEYQLVTYRLDGVLYTAYLPAEGEPEIIDRVSGTKASADFLAHLSFNPFFLNTPLYREVQRLNDLSMRVSRMTLTNWLYKGSRLLAGTVKYLKDMALEKDSVINCDETWCRVKVFDRYRKRYIWCLVNREAKIAIYCYEDGSRGRDALKAIIEGKEINALQSDGYNVYMYLNADMVNITHICCLAHARAKFQYALEQGNDPDAKYILDCIAELYALEQLYTENLFSTEEITAARQSLQTKEIIGRIRSKLDVLLSENHPPRGELMGKAVRYLATYWKPIFAYTENGRYSIDNNAAERCIRPLAGERKNSLFFGSHKMAKASAIYHTVMATCRMNGISVLDYLRKFFGEIVRGNTDYSRLLPQTIGLSPISMPK